jgi:ribosomal protein S18 acetylase RimI-like enzyme
LSNVLLLVYGFVISPAPPLDANRFVSETKDSVVQVPAKTAKVRIRSTREQDLDEISRLLANAIVDRDTLSPQPSGNWKTYMKFLNTKASMKSLLSNRYQVLREGNRALTMYNGRSEDEFSMDRLELLWSHDDFRTKLEKAVMMSKEPHVWGKHNFAYSPSNVCHLQHLMMTAFDANSGKIIGFCEVAMMTRPHSHDDSTPTIANLVTSTAYRRMGVGSGLLKSALRFVHEYWREADEVALFVDRSNWGAASLYSKLGFCKAALCEEQDGMLYMTRPLL